MPNYQIYFQQIKTYVIGCKHPASQQIIITSSIINPLLSVVWKFWGTPINLLSTKRKHIPSKIIIIKHLNLYFLREKKNEFDSNDPLYHPLINWMHNKHIPPPYFFWLNVSSEKAKRPWFCSRPNSKPTKTCTKQSRFIKITTIH